MKTAYNWIKQNRYEFILILFILLIAAFFRFYKIDQYMTFLGDEGRDALVIKRILTTFDLPLLGPPTSVGNMYLGPLYYYMMTIPMAVFYLNPVAAASMVAVIGVLTVGLIYYLSREWFGKLAALTAAALYAVSPIAIIYAKSSWNPNPTPFFALLTILGFYLARYQDYKWLILSFASLAFAIQMHYLALLLVPLAMVLWIYEFLSFRHPEFISGSEIPNQVRNDGKSTNFLVGTIIGITSFVILMSPLVIFDLKYNYMNYRAFTTFLFSKDSSVAFSIGNFLEKLFTIYQYNLVERYIAGPNLILIIITFVLVGFSLVVAGFKQFTNKKFFSWPMFVLTSWLVMGLIGLSFYKQEIYDHYVGFLNPVPFLLIGANFYFIQRLGFKFKKQLNWGLLLFCIILIVANIFRSPLQNPPNNQLKKTQEIAKFIIQQAQGKPFNFALIAKNNYDSAYQFYLDQYGSKPKQVPFENTEQLFVVCEDPVCQPTTNPKYEIAGFGMSKIEKETDFAGVKVYKLIANPSGKP